MKRITFLKSLLLAAGLSVGASAWGQTYTYEVLYGLETITNGVTTGVTPQTDFTGDEHATTLENAWTDPNGNSTTDIPSLEGSVLCANSSASWTKNFASPITEGKVYFSGVYVTPHNYKNNYPYSGNNYMLQILDSKGVAIFKSATHCKNGNSSSVLTIGSTTIDNTVRMGSKAPHYIKSLCIDLDARTVTYDVNVSSGSGSFTNKTGSVELSEGITDVKGLYVIQSTADYSGGFIDMVTLYSLQSSNPTYIVNYKLGDEIVKTVTGRNEVGTTITADNIVYGSDNTKYFCSAATLPSMELVAASESNVLNVPVRKAYQATLNVTYSIGGVNESPVSTVFTEADDNSCNWNYVYSLYVKKDNIYYKADNTQTFGESGSFTDGQVINKTVSYTNADPNVVYFREGESTNGSNFAYSNGGAADISAKNARNQGVDLGSLTTGLYKVTVEVVNSRNVLLRDKNNPSTELLVFSQDSKTHLLPLTEEKTLILNGPSIVQNNTEKAALSGSYDYIIIQKINTMSIVGEFQGDWNPTDGIAMTQSIEDPTIWTAVVNNYTITSSKYDYQYKAIANGNWNDYVIGNPNASNTDKNQEYGFNYEGAREGIYNLTFTANLTNNTVELSVKKQPTATVYFVNTENWDAANIRIWVWDANNNYNYTGGNWDHQPTMTAEGNDIYSWSTYELNPTPTTLIISNNLSETARIEKPFVNGATYKVDGSLTVPATISASGYSTFATPYPLDLTGVTAYKATSVNGTTVHFEALNQTVPANTGVLLKGTANGTVNIPVASEGAEVNDNLFMVNTSGNTFEANDIDTYYYFGLINGASLTFGTFNPNTVAIPANKAYLKVAKSNFSSGARLSFSFDEDTTTGITNNKRETISNNRYYNLNGQRVDNPTKGMYIVNGKKVIIK